MWIQIQICDYCTLEIGQSDTLTKKLDNGEVFDCCEECAGVSN